ncbi:hypothetical protein GCM10027347_58770 [Larkinella harenae]
MASNLTLQEPFLNCVYQRDSSGNSFIPVAGTVGAGIENVKAVFSRVKVGEIQTMEYALPIEQTLPVDKDGNFGGTVQLPGGWYSLAVSAGDSIKRVDRVGAGEVFVIFGHSFMQGGHDQNNQAAATDERVIALQDNLATRNYQFGRLTGKIGPFHDYPDSWGQLGDKLVRRLNVPVMFYGCAYGGSNILQNWQLLSGQVRTQMPPGITDKSSRQPFLPLEHVMQNYVSKTGIRAILVEHGYNDRGTPTSTFVERFKYVFDYVRNTYQKPNLALVLVQEELTKVPNSLADIDTAKGQQELLQSYPNTWKGPDFNNSFWIGYHINTRYDHLYGVGVDQFANDWAASLSDDFLRNSTPYVGTVTPDIFPAVLYNAPTFRLNTLDWVLLFATAVVCVLVFIKQKKSLMWAFLLLALLSLSRLAKVLP